MRGTMAIDVIAKWIIVLVAVVIVTELFLHFSGKFNNPFEEYFQTKKELDFPMMKEQNMFSGGEISTYIESCYSTMTSLPDNEQKDIDCYTLFANSTFSSFVTKGDILNNLEPEIKDHVEIKTNFNKERLIIRFKDNGDKIIVADSVKNK